ncbi:MAG: class I SAM-dependent methyltransferase [Ilumatobacter sp.]
MAPGPIAPSDFYTGLVAELYRHLRSETFEAEPYARFVERSGEPALELGCGDGDPMLDLLSRGLVVEGLDSSADMLDRCRSAAAARGLDVVLHHATFEEMDLGERYRSIYLAGATFNLLPDDETAGAAMGRIAAHLHPDGSALIPLFVPPAPTEAEIGSVRERVTQDGAVMRVTVLEVVRDEVARDQTTELRYESIRGGDHHVVDRSWRLHWFEQDRFAAMVADAGLVTRSVRSANGGSASRDDTSFSFVVGPAPT